MRETAPAVLVYSYVIMGSATSMHWCRVNRITVYPGAFLGLVLVLMTAVSQADAYRWEDADGNVHYGDAPPKSAVRVRSVDLHECRDEDCRAELARRRAETVDSYRDLSDWLDEREAARRESAQSASEPATVIVSSPPPLWSLAPVAVPAIPYGINDSWRPPHHFPSGGFRPRPIPYQDHGSARLNQRFQLPK